MYIQQILASLIFAALIHLGELLLRSEELNSQLCASLTSRMPSLTTPADQSNPFGLYDYLLVYHPEEHTATMELLETVEKGWVNLLDISNVSLCTH